MVDTDGNRRLAATTLAWMSGFQFPDFNTVLMSVRYLGGRALLEVHEQTGQQQFSHTFPALVPIN